MQIFLYTFSQLVKYKEVRKEGNFYEKKIHLVMKESQSFLLNLRSHLS